MSKVERYLPLVVGLFMAAPTLVARYLPMSDLPLHEGAVGVLRHLNDEAWFPHGLYRLNLGHPNQLFHVVAWALSYVVSTSTALKIVVAAAQVLIFVGGARLADHLGRSRWSVILLAPLALGFAYYWGLVANLVGYAALLFTLPTLDRFAEKPSLTGAAKSCVLFVLLFFAHETILISAAAVLGLFAVLKPLSRATALRLAPVVFGALVTFGHNWWQARFFTKAQFVPAPIFLSFGKRLKLLTGVIFGSHDPEAQVILAILTLGIVACFIAGRFREKASPETWRERLWRHRFELAGLCHLIGYFVAPFNWNGATLVHERFVGPAWALLVLSAAPNLIVSSPRIVRLLAPTLPLGILLLSWPQFADADATYRNLDEIIEKIPMRTTVTLAVVDRVPFRTRIYSASPGPARIVAIRGGRIGLSLMTSPISPVQVAPEYRWDDYEMRLQSGGSMSLRPEFDLRLFEWLIVVSRDPDTRRRVRLALAGDADFVERRGEFVLFHSRHQLVPLMSGDHVVPPEITNTLVDRLFELEARGIPLPPDEDDATP